MLRPRAMLVAWDLVVLAAVGAYASRFSRIAASSVVFPRLIAYPVLAFTLASLAAESLQLARGRPAEGTQAEDRVSVVRLLLGVFYGAVYLLLWKPLGFELDTALLLVAVPLLLGHPWRRLAAVLAVAVATPLVVAFLFHLGSGAILPSGFLEVGWP